MEDAIGDRDLKRLSQRRLNIFAGSISSYCYIINSPTGFHMIKQEKQLASVLCDIYYDRLEEKQDRNKRVMETEDYRKQ